MKTVAELLQMLSMPQECVQTLCTCEKALHKNAEAEFASALSYYLSGEADRPTAQALLSALCEKSGQCGYSSDMVVVLSAFVRLEAVYEKLGLSHALYENACRDARCKLLECYQLHGVWGTFAPLWFLRWFVPNRFALGRMQFQKAALTMPGVEKVVFDGLPNGRAVEITEGAPVIQMHIPSTGEPITDALRMDAYRQAYDFYAAERKDGFLLFSCKSWLLYEKQREFLPEKSNILRFMDDFYILQIPVFAPCGDLWRIFMVPNETPYEALPEDTSLRLAYKKHLLAGGEPVQQLGLFLFDGSTIYNQATMIEKPLG